VKTPADPKSRQFLQLNRFRRERTPVHVYLLTGTRFTGRIRSFDVHTLLLETQHGEMVIYGHAVSTIEPAALQRGRRAPARGPREAGAPEGRGPARSRPLPDADADANVDADADEAPPARAPAPAPTVTIVRRRSRLAPRSGE
jgi:host factor-I protein